MVDFNKSTESLKNLVIKNSELPELLNVLLLSKLRKRKIAIPKSFSSTEINWKEIEKQSLDQTINTLSMASPFSLEEKQVLLESKDLNNRKEKLEEILNTYILDNFNNKTLQ